MRCAGIEIEVGAAIARAWQVQRIDWLAPVPFWGHAENCGGRDGDFKTLMRDLVGVDLIVDIGVVLLGRGHPKYLEAMQGAVEARSAAPEIGHGADDGKRTILEPVSIVRGEIVLPLR